MEDQLRYRFFHDIKAYMRNAKGYAQAIEEDFPEVMTDELFKMLDAIKTNAHSAFKLVEDYSYLMKLNGSSIHRETISLAPLAMSIGNGLVDGRTKDIKLDFHIDPDITFRADPKRFKRMLTELLGNAVKFASNDQAMVGLYTEESQKHVFLQIEDNGIGIEEKYRDLVFRPFEKLHPDSVYPGSGLGLSIASEIVKLHNWQISLDNTKSGPGCAFTIQIPKNS